MILPGLLAVRRFLRSPKVIIGEILAIIVAGVLGATFPQIGIASGAELAQWRGGSPGLGAAIRILSLDHVFRSQWFLLLLAVTAASLSIVVAEQVRRVRVMWACKPTVEQFRRAPYRAEFERPARTAGPRGENHPTVAIRTEGRFGLVGSPLFHFGLLLVMVAGTLRSLYSVDAVVDLIEGETLPPTARAWAAQWPGALAQPFRLDRPMTLERVNVGYYEHGQLRDLSAQLSFEGVGAVEGRQIGINQEVAAPGGRLYTESSFGPAALLEWQAPGTPPIRRAMMLSRVGGGDFEGSAAAGGGIRVYTSAGNPRHEGRPTQVEVRVLKGRALLFAGAIRPGEEVRLPAGETLRLHGLPYWARLHGSRDPALWLTYAGFLLVLAGAALMFGTTRVDTLIGVARAGDRELVTVAMQPQRFHPLFQESFERLVREQGGTV